MMKNEQLVRVLCLPHCIYYKPGKNEEYLCRGAVVVERLLRVGKQLTTVRSVGPRETVMDESLVRNVCRDCDFHERDCDFMQDHALTPCGGFLLLEQLLGSGVITMEELR